MATILVVDDMAVNLQVLGSFLGGQRYQVLVAKSGTEALSIIPETNPDLILLDIEMPEMNGYEVCRRLKNDPATREIPVIFLTSHDTADDIVAGFEAGAVDYVTKPFNRAELLARVRTHLELRQSREEIARAYRELMLKDQIMNDDLAKARDIQGHVFLIDRDNFPDIELCVHYQPFIQVGGDIYDACRVREGYYRFFIADATGHGIQAALVTMLIKSVYDKFKMDSVSPGEILLRLNESFYRNYYKLMVLFTACIIDVDIACDILLIANAGHPTPYVTGGGRFFKLPSTGGSIIGIDSAKQYRTAEVPFKAGDSVIMFTDGLYEDLLRERNRIEMDDLEEIMQRHTEKRPDELVSRIVRDVTAALNGAAFTDDVTVMEVRRRG